MIRREVVKLGAAAAALREIRERIISLRSSVFCSGRKVCGST
jgi:hypothetical protein